MNREQLLTPIQYVKGVGPRLAKVLSRLSIETVEDIFYYLPRDYEDRTKIQKLSEIRAGEEVLILGEIEKLSLERTRKGFSILRVFLKEDKVPLVFFNQPFLRKTFKKGLKIVVSGKINENPYHASLEFYVKEYEIVTEFIPQILPIYNLTEGLTQKKMRKIVREALFKYLKYVKDFRKEGNLALAISKLHFPKNILEAQGARERLAFDDFFLFELGLALKRRGHQVKAQGVMFDISDNLIKDFKETLPFKLTTAQERVLAEIFSDLKSGIAMNRLLQGDVGSGKTIVAALSIYVAVKNGLQAALMVPTEILARQHYQKLETLLDGFGIKLELLVSSRKNKDKIKEKIKSGKVDLVVGTHALLEENVKFKELGLIVIDEQHRFGVLQREKLSKRGINPHLLFMTATPIPRSLALTLYGDLDRSVIDEMPPGRKPVKTYFIKSQDYARMYEFVRTELMKGSQAYIIYPLVEESLKLDLKAAEKEFLYLKEEIFPDLNLGLIHGRLKTEEKSEVMEKFNQGKIQVLCATTVIEVGIDVPRANIMIIEHAERFGLSQLHQLRGRVGRGKETSYCFLLGSPKSDNSKSRIKALTHFSDGFKIAEEDLKLRGPGDFYGERQSGLPLFRVADILKDVAFLQKARKAAFEIIAKDPELLREENQAIKREFFKRYQSFEKVGLN